MSATRMLASMTAGLALLGACQTTPTEADLIFRNGPIFTANANGDVAEVVVVDDGKIVAVGSTDLLETYAAPTIVDLHGRLLIPGFNDAHTHIHGNPPGFVAVSGARSIAELAELVAGMTEVVEPGEWITGYGWSEDRLSEGRKPTRFDLDAVSPDNPVYLTREGGHSGVANSKALEIAGLTAETPQPEGGEIGKNADGQLTGVITERNDLVRRHIPPSDEAEIAADLARNLNKQFALGITSLTDASTGPDQYAPLWKRAYAEAELPLPRATVQIRPTITAGNADAAIESLRAFGAVTGEGDEHLKVGALKIFVDGGFTGPAAYTTQGYRNDPSYHGSLTAPLSDIEAVARAAHEMGWQFGFHTIGDAAIDQTVVMIDGILADAPKADHRHYLNHFSMTPKRETIELLVKDGVAIVQQPNFTYSLEGRYTQYLPDDAQQVNNPVATPLNMGAQMAFSSDIIPMGPLIGVYAAVTRKGASGTVYGPDERIDVKQAIRLYTHGGAWVNFDEDIKGEIAPGMLADLVVLSEDILTAPPEEILKTKVDMTVLGGEIVYERPEQ